MLPFLKKRDAGGGSGVITLEREPDESKSSESDDNYDGIKECAKDLLSAIEAKDIDAIAKAMEDAFDILEARPHSEGPHTNE